MMTRITNKINIVHICPISTLTIKSTISFQELPQFFLDKVKFFGCVVDFRIEFVNDVALLIDFSVHVFTLCFQSYCDFVDFLKMLVLLLNELILHFVHDVKI